MEYDEREMIEWTIYRYYGHLRTPREHELSLAFLAKAKAEGYRNPAVEERMRTRMGNVGDPEIQAVLERGFQAFRCAVADRILREHGSEVTINRCPACQRVVRTPMAKWCMWCKFDWH